MNLRPLGDKIAVSPFGPQGMVGMLYMPANKNTANQTFHRAKVMAVGPKALAKPGDTVLVSEYFGDPFDVGGTRVFIGRERDIVGVMNE